jgi:hypothetical protein
VRALKWTRYSEDLYVRHKHQQNYSSIKASLPLDGQEDIEAPQSHLFLVAFFVFHIAWRLFCISIHNPCLVPPPPQIVSTPGRGRKDTPIKPRAL